MIDLHTHSTVSDGSDAPARIPELAAEAGCTAVALTDHDRLDGVAEARARAGELGVDLVPGCELSCAFGPGTMHVLVYFLEPGDGPLQDALEGLQQERDARNRQMAERLSQLGLPVTYEDLEEESGGTGTGRPHMAAVLVRKGVVSTVGEAFEKWLAKGKAGYVEKRRLPPSDAIALARASGAVPVLAHPLSLELDPGPLEATVIQLREMGLAGVEAIYGRYSPEERADLAAMAARNRLVATGGSDHHGTYKPDLKVGLGQGDLDVPDDVLGQLADRRPG
ncbi:MAG TPA: PHP domain-containing protein [Acidimicrobiales bacterium]|nr:PHP domain-containing protein [Acidimicrobiales bacterium]